MRKDMMDILACPVCKGPLTLEVTIIVVGQQKQLTSTAPGAATGAQQNSPDLS